MIPSRFIQNSEIKIVEVVFIVIGESFQNKSEIISKGLTMNIDPNSFIRNSENKIAESESRVKNISANISRWKEITTNETDKIPRSLLGKVRGGFANFVNKLTQRKEKNEINLHEQLISKLIEGNIAVFSSQLDDHISFQRNNTKFSLNELSQLKDELQQIETEINILTQAADSGIIKKDIVNKLKAKYDSVKDYKFPVKDKVPEDKSINQIKETHQPIEKEVKEAPQPTEKERLLALNSNLGEVLNSLMETLQSTGDPKHESEVKDELKKLDIRFEELKGEYAQISQGIAKGTISSLNENDLMALHSKFRTINDYLGQFKFLT